eukprot:tig00000552_g2069.t1
MCPAKAGSPLPAAERSHTTLPRRAAGGERASSKRAALYIGRWRPDAPRAASAPRRNRDQAVLRPSQAGAGGPTRRVWRARLVVTDTRLDCGRAKADVISFAAGARGPTRRVWRARLVVTDTRLDCGRAKRALAARRAAGGECASP